MGADRLWESPGGDPGVPWGRGPWGTPEGPWEGPWGTLGVPGGSPGGPLGEGSLGDPWGTPGGPWGTPGGGVPGGPWGTPGGSPGGPLGEAWGGLLGDPLGVPGGPLGRGPWGSLGDPLWLGPRDGPTPLLVSGPNRLSLLLASISRRELATLTHYYRFCEAARQVSRRWLPRTFGPGESTVLESEYFA